MQDLHGPGEEIHVHGIVHDLRRIRLTFFLEERPIEAGYEVLVIPFPLDIELDAETRRFRGIFPICHMPREREPMTPFILRPNGDFYRPVLRSEGRGTLGEDGCQFESRVIPTEAPGNICALAILLKIMTKDNSIAAVYNAAVWLEDQHVNVIRTANFLDACPSLANLTMLEPIHLCWTSPVNFVRWTRFNPSMTVMYEGMRPLRVDIPHFCVLGRHRTGVDILCSIGASDVKYEFGSRFKMRFILALYNRDGVAGEPFCGRGAFRGLLVEDYEDIRKIEINEMRCVEGLWLTSFVVIGGEGEDYDRDSVRLPGPWGLSERVRRVMDEYNNRLGVEYGFSVEHSECQDVPTVYTPDDHGDNHPPTHRDTEISDRLYEVLQYQGTLAVLTAEATPIPREFRVAMEYSDDESASESDDEA